MIESFNHKGLKRLFEDDDHKLSRQDLERIAVLLGYLDNAEAIEEFDIPSLSAFVSFVSFVLSQCPLCCPCFFNTKTTKFLTKDTKGHP